MKTKFEDVGRLPQWAQRRIAKLTADVEYHKERAMSVASEAGTSVVVGGISARPKQYLPNGTRVGFRLTDRQSIEVYVNQTGDGVTVFADGGYLAFWPEVTNVGTLKVVQR
jgi:hypothetical protein